jgi:hypothetical protein
MMMSRVCLAASFVIDHCCQNDFPIYDDDDDDVLFISEIDDADGSDVLMT